MLAAVSKNRKKLIICFQQCYDPRMHIIKWVVDNGVLIGIGVHALYGKLIIVPGEHWLMVQKDARRDLRVCRDGQGGGDQVDLSIAARVSRRRGNFPDRHPVQRSQA